MTPRATRILRRAHPAALLAVAAALVLALPGCGDDDEDGNGDTSTAAVAGDEIVDPDELLGCLRDAGLSIGEPGSDAVLAPYATEAVDRGGDTFVIENPIAQVIVFADPVDLGRAEEELGDAAARGGVRATGLQADVAGNVLVAYFVQQGADKDPVNECLGGEPEPVPGFEAPFQPADPEAGLTPAE